MRLLGFLKARHEDLHTNLYQALDASGNVRPRPSTLPWRARPESLISPRERRAMLMYHRTLESALEQIQLDFSVPV